MLCPFLSLDHDFFNLYAVVSIYLYGYVVIFGVYFESFYMYSKSLAVRDPAKINICQVCFGIFHFDIYS